MTAAHPLFPGITWDDLAAELRREHEARSRLYPARVASGRMTEAESARQRGVILAIAGDVERMRAGAIGIGMGRAPAAHEFSWTERRTALLREAALRARHYPDWIAEKRLDQATADRRCACIEILLRIYEDGFDWRPPGGLAPPYWIYRDGAATPRMDEPYRLARADCLAMLFDGYLRQGNRPMAEAAVRQIEADDPTRAAELAARLNPEEQKELAL